MPNCIEMFGKLSPRRKKLVWRIIIPCCLGAFWMFTRAAQFGDATALLAIGPDNTSYRFVHREMPHAYVFAGNGFDGMPFYVIARHPLNVRAIHNDLDVPTYRLRRILYPALAKVIVPAGGENLVYAFAALSLLGIAMGAWWLGSFPNAPPWLPVTMALSPGVICSLYTSTGDTLAAGLTIACIGAAFSRRFTLAIVFLAFAALTRETSLIAVLALGLWPGITWSRRLANVIVPAIPVVAWSGYVSVTLHESFFTQPSAGSFSLPFMGFVHSGITPGQILYALACGGLVFAAMIRSWKALPAISVFLAANLVVFVCAAPIIANSWLGFTRIVTAAVPIAFWVLVVPQKTLRRVGPFASNAVQSEVTTTVASAPTI